MIFRICEDKSFEAFSQINHLSVIAGLGTYSTSRIQAVISDESIHVRRLVLPNFSRNALGFIVFRQLPPESEIFDLSIQPLFQRIGLGRILLRHVLDSLIRRGVTACFLEVRGSNETAIRFYENNDFRVIHVRRNYYRHPEESALLMKWVPDLEMPRSITHF